MIKADSLSKSYGPKPILEGVSFIVHEKEKIGLVGPNGTGKTTLLKIILGQEESDGGSVDTKGEKIGYLPQKISFSENQTVENYLMENLDNQWEAYKIESALSKVGLGPSDKNLLVAKVSGGQKTRAAIARLLINEPTTLLLDEPTNNLDFAGIEWFENFVRDFNGSVIVVSHDRTFLDNTVAKIFELDPFTHTIEQYQGGYSDFIVQRHEKLEQQLKEYDRFETKKKKMEEWIALKQQQLSIYINPKVGSQLQAMKTRYQREIVNQEIDKPQDYKKIRVSDVGSKTHASKLIFKIKNAEYPNIVKCKEIAIFGSDRIYLQGPNGSGKTTFIKMLLGLVKRFTGEVNRSDNVKIGYFAQEHEILDDSKVVIQEFKDQTSISDESVARNTLGKFLFTGNNVFHTISSLSQGEKVKLIIAILTNQNNSFLILDEPTNHLDLESREVLEHSLSQYKGGFLVVSHDRYFLKQIDINRQLEIVSGEIKEKF